MSYSDATNAQDMLDDLARQHVRRMTNNSGATVDPGDVVVVDPTVDGNAFTQTNLEPLSGTAAAFTTTTTPNETRMVGVVVKASIADGADGYVRFSGWAPLVNVTVSVSRGDYGYTSSTAGGASASGTRSSGAFCQFLHAGTTPDAFLFGMPDGSSGSALTVEEVDGSPTDSAVTKLVFPNGTLSITSHVATVTLPTGAAAASIGDGSSTSFAVTHSLGTTDVIVQLWDLTGTDPVEATSDASSITATDDNTVTIVFGSAPASDAYRVVVLKSGSGTSSRQLLTAVQLTTQTAVNPEPGTPTAVPGLSSISITLPTTQNLVVRYTATYDKGTDTDRVRFQPYIDGSAVAGISNVYYGLPSSDNKRHVASFMWVIASVASGIHTVVMRHSAAIGTSSTTFTQQHMTVESA